MKIRIILTLVAGLLAGLGPGVASAEDWRIKLFPDETDKSMQNLMTPVGAAIQIGGGVSDFTNDRMRDRTEPAGSWQVRAVIGTRSVIAGELAYVGTAQDITALGLDRDTTLVRNGLEAAVRFNLPIVRDEWTLEPFAFVGIGWARYDLINDDFNTSDVRENDDVGVVPLGGGFSVSYQNFMVDTRLTYRPTFDEDLLRGGGGSDNWAVTGALGYQF
ncbi:MAG: hypothetical protein HYY06_07670 [Deltaproteobacteria bacterium]|nr:hypothetical protein [Deltaproteobacteria bacterium]